MPPCSGCRQGEHGKAGTCILVLGCWCLGTGTWIQVLWYCCIASGAAALLLVLAPSPLARAVPKDPLHLHVQYQKTLSTCVCSTKRPSPLVRAVPRNPLRLRVQYQKTQHLFLADEAEPSSNLALLQVRALPALSAHALLYCTSQCDSVQYNSESCTMQHTMYSTVQYRAVHDSTAVCSPT